MIRLTGYAVLAIAFCAMAIACGNNEEEARQQAEQQAQQLAQAMEQAQQQQPAPTPPPAGGGESNFGTVSLSPGFMPDPHTTSGTSGGAVNASTLNAGCAGWIAQTPDHLFQAGSQFGNLRVLVKTADATQDTTLVIQKPDGSYVCDDDSEEMNPIINLTNAPAGTYKIWIGSYAQGANYQYTLGFSELSNTTAASLGG